MQSYRPSVLPEAPALNIVRPLNRAANAERSGYLCVVKNQLQRNRTINPLEPHLSLEPHLLPTLIILARPSLDSYGLLLILELRRAVRQSLLRRSEPGIERKGLSESCRCPIMLIE
jgi:hypothetical protein